jgi:hypothetical protein
MSVKIEFAPRSGCSHVLAFGDLQLNCNSVVSIVAPNKTIRMIDWYVHSESDGLGAGKNGSLYLKYNGMTRFELV